jgi:hypothetical protein
MPTWSGISQFECEGAVGGDLTMYYGAEFRSRISVRVSQINALLTVFKGKEVPIGTSRTSPPRGSVGEWLQRYVTRTAIASYIGPILIADGVARRGGDSDRIKFL